MNEQLLETLIGKFLDSEITPAEQQMLDEQLKTNPRAVEMLEQLENLKVQAQQALTIEITESGEPAEAVFERALKNYHARQKKRQTHLIQWVRVAANIAAVLTIAIAAYYLVGHKKASPTAEETVQEAIADKPGGGPELQTAPKIIELARPSSPENQIDWWRYTDRNGTEWILETYKNQNNTESAVYSGEL